MRMGLSGLNTHRRKYNFINDNTCALCNTKAENTYHYTVPSLPGLGHTTRYISIQGFPGID